MDNSKKYIKITAFLSVFLIFAVFGTIKASAGICDSGVSTCTPGPYTFFQNAETCGEPIGYNSGNVCSSNSYCASNTTYPSPTCFASSGTGCKCLLSGGVNDTAIGNCCQPLNSFELATQETASAMASCLGATVRAEPQSNTYFYASVPTYDLVFSNGRILNAGAVANGYMSNSKTNEDQSIAYEACGISSTNTGGTAGNTSGNTASGPSMSQAQFDTASKAFSDWATEIAISMRSAGHPSAYGFSTEGWGGGVTSHLSANFYIGTLSPLHWGSVGSLNSTDYNNTNGNIQQGVNLVWTFEFGTISAPPTVSAESAQDVQDILIAKWYRDVTFALISQGHSLVTYLDTGELSGHPTMHVGSVDNKNTMDASMNYLVSLTSSDYTNTGGGIQKGVDLILSRANTLSTSSGTSSTSSNGAGTTGIGTSYNSQMTAYVQNLTNIVNNMIQKYKNMLNSIGTQTSNTNNVTAETTGTTNFPATITVNATLLNVRSAPNTSAVIVNQLSKGSTFTAMSTVKGENVEGTDDWWVTSDSTYIWTGGTTQ